MQCPSEAVRAGSGWFAGLDDECEDEPDRDDAAAHPKGYSACPLVDRGIPKRNKKVTPSMARPVGVPSGLGSDVD